jgi:hypothetical protein
VLTGAQIHGFLSGRQQIEQQRREASFAQDIGNESVARTEPAGSAAMREKDNTAWQRFGWCREPQRSAERDTACGYMNRKLIGRLIRVHAHTPIRKKVHMRTSRVSPVWRPRPGLASVLRWKSRIGEGIDIGRINANI